MNLQEVAKAIEPIDIWTILEQDVLDKEKCYLYGDTICQDIDLKDVELEDEKFKFFLFDIKGWVHWDADIDVVEDWINDGERGEGHFEYVHEVEEVFDSVEHFKVTITIKFGDSTFEFEKEF